MNRKVIIAVVVIGGAGVMNSVMANPPKPLTPVIIGSYIFLFILSIMDMFGGPMSTLAGALAMVAVTFVLLTEIPWKTIISVAQGTNSTPTPTTPSQPIAGPVPPITGVA